MCDIAAVGERKGDVRIPRLFASRKDIIVLRRQDTCSLLSEYPEHAVDAGRHQQPVADCCLPFVPRRALMDVKYH